MSENIKPNPPELDEQKRLTIHREESEFKKLTEDDLCYVRFSVRSEEHTSSDLSQLFELEPQDLMDDGEVVFENNRYLIYNTGGYWVLNSRYEVKSKYIEDHIEWLLDKLYDKRDLIMKLQEQGVIIKLKVHAEPRSGLAFCRLDKHVIKRFAQLNLDVDFHLICRGKIKN